MNNIGYKLTDWIFFFNERNKQALNQLLNHVDNRSLIEELITWKILSVALPIATFLVALSINLATNMCRPELFYSFVNNGSIPIISFGILTSGMPYLLEQLGEYPDFHTIRRRVMAIAMIFLFLSSCLYTIQTLQIVSTKLNCIANFILMSTSIVVFLFSSSIGFKMFVLQSKNIPAFDENVQENVDDLMDAVDDLG